MKYLPNVLLTILISLFGASFFGVLFVAGDAYLLGILGFVLMGVVAFMHKGFRGHTIVFFKLWLFIGLAFVCCFLILIIFSPKGGAPEIGHLPILATRPHYYFSRGGGDFSRVRFVVVAVAFHLAWHSFAIGIALEQWARLKRSLLK